MSTSLDAPSQQPKPAQPMPITNVVRSDSVPNISPQKPQQANELAPIGRSRRNSESSIGPAPSPTPTAAPTAGGPGTAATQAGLVPLLQGPIQARAENTGLVPRVDWTNAADHLSANSAGRHDSHVDHTPIYVGKIGSRRTFNVRTSELVEASPFFKKLLAEDTGHAGRTMTAEQTTFDDLDEFAMALFLLWLQDGGILAGPHDFHSLAHYLGLYVLAQKFQVEVLENQVVDLVRHYYANQSMTAPAFRLEYIYRYTHGPNHMRTFLIGTAAYRALEEAPRSEITSAARLLHGTFYAPGQYVSSSIRDLLAEDSEMAIDFIEALVKLHSNHERDVRQAPDCEFHVHEHTPVCPRELPREPWQADGPSDDKRPGPPANPVTPTRPAEPKKDDTKLVDKKPDLPKSPPESKKELPKVAAPGGPVAPTEATKRAQDVKPAAAPPPPAVPAVFRKDDKPVASSSKKDDKTPAEAAKKKEEPPKDEDNPFNRWGKKVKGKMEMTALKSKLGWK